METSQSFELQTDDTTSPNSISVKASKEGSIDGYYKDTNDSSPQKGTSLHQNGLRIAGPVLSSFDSANEVQQSHILAWAAYQERLKTCYYILKAEDQYFTQSKNILEKASRKLHLSYANLHSLNTALFEGSYFEKDKKQKVLQSDDLEKIADDSSFPLQSLLKKLHASPENVALLLKAIFERESKNKSFTSREKECLDFLLNQLYGNYDGRNSNITSLFKHIIGIDSQGIFVPGSFTSRMLVIFLERMECQQYLKVVFKYIKKDPLNHNTNICTDPMEFDYHKKAHGKWNDPEIKLQPNIFGFTAPSYKNEPSKKERGSKTPTNSVLNCVDVEIGHNSQDDIEFYYPLIANFISAEGREAFENDITLIVKFVNGIFEKLFKSLNTIPYHIRLIGKTICEMSYKKNPDISERNKLLLGFLFSLGIIPFIENLRTDSSEGVAKALIILRKIVLNKRFPKGELLDFLNPYIDSFKYLLPHSISADSSIKRVPLTEFYDDFVSTDDHQEKEAKGTAFKFHTFGFRGTVAAEILDTIMSNETLSKKLPEAEKFVDKWAKRKQFSQLSDYFIYFCNFTPEDAMNQQFVEQLLKTPKVPKNEPESFKHLVHCKASLVNLLVKCEDLNSYHYKKCKSFDEVLSTLEEDSAMKEIKPSRQTKRIGTPIFTSFLKGFMLDLAFEYTSDNYFKLLEELNADLEVRSKELIEKAKCIKIEAQNIVFCLKKQRRLLKGEVLIKTAKLRKSMVYDNASKLQVALLIRSNHGKLELQSPSKSPQKRHLRGANNRAAEFIELNTIKDFVETFSNWKPWEDLLNIRLDSKHLEEANAIFCEYFNATFDLFYSEIQKKQEEFFDEEKEEEDEDISRHEKKQEDENLRIERHKEDLKADFHNYITELLYKKIFPKESSAMDHFLLNICTEFGPKIVQKLDIPENMKHKSIWDPIVQELRNCEQKCSCIGKLRAISKILLLLTNYYRLCAGPYSEVGTDIGLNLMLYTMVQGLPRRLHSDLLFIRCFLLDSYQAGVLGYCSTTMGSVKSWIENFNKK